MISFFSSHEKDLILKNHFRFFFFFFFLTLKFLLKKSNELQKQILEIKQFLFNHIFYKEQQTYWFICWFLGEFYWIWKKKNHHEFWIELMKKKKNFFDSLYFVIQNLILNQMNLSCLEWWQSGFILNQLFFFFFFIFVKRFIIKFMTKKVTSKYSKHYWSK